MNLSPRMQYVLVYLFWVVTCLATLFLLLQLYTSLGALLSATGLHRYTQRVIGQFSMILLGLACLGFMIYVENSYRTAVKKNYLLTRFLRISYIQAAFLALTHLLLVIAHIVVGQPAAAILLILGIEVAACALLYWLARRAETASLTR